MTDRDVIYLKILKVGLVSLRNAAYSGNTQYWIIEAEHLHNLPSLVGESNESRHEYYFDAERHSYLESVDRSMPEVRYTLARYDELWCELEGLRKR
jgi:hypothetical protein